MEVWLVWLQGEPVSSAAASWIFSWSGVKRCMFSIISAPVTSVILTDGSNIRTLTSITEIFLTRMILYLLSRAVRPFIISRLILRSGVRKLAPKIISIRISLLRLIFLRPFVYREKSSPLFSLRRPRFMGNLVLFPLLNLMGR